MLEVDRLPDVWLTDESMLKQQNACRLVMDGWKPQNDQDQEYLDALRYQWETEEPPCLTITINLKSPSYLIIYALEFLIPVCKADLGISDDKIDGDMIHKCFKAWDLRQQGMSDEQISNEIPLRKYELKDEQRNAPEMAEADHEIDSDTYYNVRRIKDYLEKAEAMIQRGAVI